MNASESVRRWAVLPLVRLRTYALRPLLSGITYLNSPSTLRAPPADWPARTDARAVLEVLLAMENPCREEGTYREVRTYVRPSQFSRRFATPTDRMWRTSPVSGHHVTQQGRNYASFHFRRR